jgi:mono/diheme cytochrome c family protein
MRRSSARTSAIGTGPRSGAAALLVLLLLAAVPALAGCAVPTGAYAPVDWASEMHYQQSYKFQEPPRLAPPPGAVPITGREVATAPGQYGQMQNPVPQTPENLSRAAELYRVNCSMCHGQQGKGDGPVNDFLVRDGYAKSPDLTAQGTAQRTDGELFGIITEGVFVMPRFKNMLTAEERWLLVQHLRRLQGQD